MLFVCREDFSISIVRILGKFRPRVIDVAVHFYAVIGIRIIGSDHFHRLAVDGDIPSPGEVNLAEHSQAALGVVALVGELVGRIGGLIDSVAGLLGRGCLEHILELLVGNGCGRRVEIVSLSALST